MRALVIDDSRAIRSILGKMLVEQGYEVEEACDGAEALSKVLSGPAPDVALVDWNMPEMNGYEFVQAARANPALDSMRLMMVTTESELTRVMEALEAGADEYVMKPFTVEIITDKLRLIGLES